MASLPPPERAALEAEGRVFARHLVGAPAPAVVLERYLEAHARGLLARNRDLERVDRLLVRLARTGRLGAFVADGHSAVFRRRGALRRKLVLLLALLETSPATHRRTLGGTAGSGVVAGLGLSGLALRGLGAALLGAVLVGPMRIGLAMLPGRKRSR